MSKLRGLHRVLRHNLGRAGAEAGMFGVGAVLLGVLVYGSSGTGLASGGATISTDHAAYVAGETVTILGSGFMPSDNVTVRVTNSDGAAEAGMGHEPTTVVADAAGAFTATWSVNPGDTGSHDFLVTATGGWSGPSTPAAFSRIAIVSTEFTNYRPGDTANIWGAGFLPGESVTLQVIHVTGASEAGAGHQPWTETADIDGKVTTTWYVDPDDSMGSEFLLAATSSLSQLSSEMMFADSGAGICSNDKTIACSVNADCGAGNTCYLPTAGGVTLANQVCLADASGSGLNCTANDISVAATSSLVVVDKDPITPGVQGCLFPGDTATISFIATFKLTAQDRYDIGVWAAQDGGNARTGRCSVTDFPVSPTPPWTDLDNFCIATGPNQNKCSLNLALACTTDAQCSGSNAIDRCGDITSTNNPIYSSIQSIQVACIDTNGDGNVDPNVCLSWEQAGGSGLCTSPLQTVVGAPSKCNCQVLPGITILVPGVIKVDKVTNPAADPTSFNFTLTKPGGATTTFSLKDADPLFNSGPLSLGTYSVAESVPSNWALTSSTCSSDQGQTQTPGNIVLHNGETVTCTFTDKKLGPCTNPDGSFLPATTICRGTNGNPCDVAESCTGTSADCPADGFAPSTTSCTGTSNGGACDGTDSCDGAGHCKDGFLSSTTTCRAAAGECDVAESCTGTSGACPADGFKPETTSCTGTSNGGACDGTDSCDGAGHCKDGFLSSTTIFRAAAGECDVAESCTGSSGACPADGFKPETTSCTRSSTGGACDGTDSCDGAGHCKDGFLTATTICRAAAGECDVAESCTGSSGACPADGFKPETTSCTGTSNGGACHGTDSCDGAWHCKDGFLTATTICRAAAGECDVAESCTGSSRGCPAHGFKPETTSCTGTSSGGACDGTDSCDGAGHCKDGC